MQFDIMSLIKSNMDDKQVNEFYSLINAASLRLRPILHNTDVLTSQSLNNETGLELYFKAENTQKTGSFKARGASNAVLSGMYYLS
jgi:threonine dehydratase